MTQREKRLAIIVGVLAGVLGVAVVSWRIYNAFDRRAKQIVELEKTRNKNEQTIQQGARAAEILQQYADRALPADPDLASSIYRDWLVKLSLGVNLKNAKVTASNARTQRDVYTAHQFRIDGEGNIEQLTDLLFQLYASDVLQRIQLLSIQPLPNKKELKIGMTVEGIAMPSAPERSELGKVQAQQLAGHDLQYYKDKITGRNIFAPENKAPNLRTDSTVVAYRGQPIDFSAQAEDPDKLDQVKYEADVSQLPGARFSSSGRLDWTPSENGEYKMTLIARDDGFPAREVKRELKISVKDPPPRVASRPSFDAAKHAYITGVTDRNGEPEVWLTIRTEGRTLKLGIGDTFKVGELEGKIAAVQGNQVTIDAGGEQLVARLGQPLAQ